MNALSWLCQGPGENAVMSREDFDDIRIDTSLSRSVAGRRLGGDAPVDIEVRPIAVVIAGLALPVTAFGYGVVPR